MKIKLICCFYIIVLFASNLIASASEDVVEIHGFISQGYMKSNYNNYLAETKDGSFQFNEMGINFSQNVTGRLRLGIQFFAKDLGSLGNDNIELDWAVADYFYRPWFGLRVGLLKLPLGFFNEVRDMDMLRPNILLPASVYNEDWRDSYTSIKGLSTYGELDLKIFGRVNYQITYGIYNDKNDSGIVKYVGTVTKSTMTQIEYDPALAFNFLWESPIDGLSFNYTRGDWDFSLSGTSGSFYKKLFIDEGSPIKITLNDYSAETFSVRYRWNSFKFIAEYFQTGGEVKVLVQNFKIPVQSRPQGWYIQGSYQFTDWFEFSTYYSEFYSDPKDKDGTKDNEDGLLEILKPDYIAFLEDLSFSFCFYINDYWTFKLEYHDMNGAAVMFFEDNLDANGNFNAKEDWNLLAAKVSFNF